MTCRTPTCVGRRPVLLGIVTILMIISGVAQHHRRRRRDRPPRQHRLRAGGERVRGHDHGHRHRGRSSAASSRSCWPWRCATAAGSRGRWSCVYEVLHIAFAVYAIITLDHNTYLRVVDRDDRAQPADHLLPLRHPRRPRVLRVVFDRTEARSDWRSRTRPGRRGDRGRPFEHPQRRSAGPQPARRPTRRPAAAWRRRSTRRPPPSGRRRSRPRWPPSSSIRPARTWSTSAPSTAAAAGRASGK